MPMQSPSQTVGPFFHDALMHEGDNILVDAQTQGDLIYIKGVVYDGEGIPIPDAMVEIWQADAEGRYSHPADPQHEQADPHFRHFGRADTKHGGAYEFKTIKPGRVRWDSVQKQAPHVNARVFARGMLIHATTRIYFSDEGSNDSDPLLASVPADRRDTLIARREDSGDLPTYRFDIHLQGDQETVFFNP